jgi:type I restriction enzyme S subunit
LHGLVPESFETYQIVNPGDIVLRTIDLQNDHTSLRVGMVRDRGIITSAYLALHMHVGVSPDFGFQFLNVWDASKAIYGYGSGLRQNLDFSHFKRMPVAVPPPVEQAAIVRFLDWANGRLERAIRAKRKVIALLNEQKQTIIHRAVTRGLDPSVPLKPSGIPWLGDIPQHWELTRLKHISSEITVGIVIQPARLYVGNGVSCLRSLNISSGRLSSDDLVFISKESHKKNSKSQLRKGDVVVVRTGRTGIAVAIDDQFDGANCVDLLIIRKSHRLSSEYLLLYLGSYGAKADIAFKSVGAIQAHYNTETLGNLRIPLPSITEQATILRSLETQLSPTDNTISRMTREIEFLREYRTCLFADVVTGKLDVRAAAAQLPDDAAPDTAKDDAGLIIDSEAIDEELAE